ncbi:MAG: guanylate kinase [Candidatus Cloacimonadaceae bacterium]
MAYHKKPFLIILSAPSGGGKSTILAQILESAENIEYSVSYTTRKPRGNEVTGVHYHFVSEEEFRARIKTGDFLEYAQFCGNFYGTSISYIRSRLEQGQHVIMDIEVQGAAQISCKDIPYVKIFILPPSLDVLKHRLTDRNTDSPKEIAKRLQTATKEITQLGNYDYLVINDKLDDAVADVWKIIRAEENRVDRYIEPENEFLQGKAPDKSMRLL